MQTFPSCMCSAAPCQELLGVGYILSPPPAGTLCGSFTNNHRFLFFGTFGSLVVTPSKNGAVVRPDFKGPGRRATSHWIMRSQNAVARREELWLKSDVDSTGEHFHRYKHLTSYFFFVGDGVKVAPSVPLSCHRLHSQLPIKQTL